MSSAIASVLCVAMAAVTPAASTEKPSGPGFAPCATAPSGMACVAGGPAIVGDDKDKAARPARTVELSTFYIDIAEVTRGAYSACVKDGACAKVPLADKGKDEEPAIITAPAAAQFCTWAGKRLPTEFEWEKAARGDAGQRYPWGDAEPTCELASFRGCKTTSSAATARYGLRAMAGGASEWTASWFAENPTACGTRCGGTDPQGPCDGATPCFNHAQLKTVKGGSSADQAIALVASARRSAPADGARHGFRCASSGATLMTWPPRQLAQQPAARPVPTAPTSEQVAIARTIEQDTLTKQVCAEKGRSFVDCRDPNHYIKSNEPRQHLWRPFVENLGGGYAGVGIDQNYSFIAHAKSEWAWLFDYDPTVVGLHHVLRAVIRDSATRQDFVAHFEAGAKDKVKGLVAEAYPAAEDRDAYVEIYTLFRAGLLGYYQRQMAAKVSVPDITKVPGENGPKRQAGVKLGDAAEDPTFGWLATEEAYQYIRALYLQDRITLLKGDMLAKKTMQGIGAAATKLRVPIRVYYPSNAPECWPHTEQYKQNVLALPFDESTVVLTSLSGIRAGFSKQRGYWHHNVQGGLLQQSFMRLKGYASLKQLIWHRRPGGDSDLTVCGLPGVAP